MKEKIILGTRGSDLALTQTGMVEEALRRRWPGLQIERRIIRTSGDEKSAFSLEANRSVAQVTPEAGRKGLFTAEIERSLVAGEIDAAVHSAKDLPSAATAGTQIAAVLPRGPVDDVLVSSDHYDLESLPDGGRVATGSVRRRHQLNWKRPDLEIVELRGNVPTRLRKLSTEDWDGIVLARAGLERLGLRTNSSPVEFEAGRLTISILPQNVFLPAGGQGIIALQIRIDDAGSQLLLDQVNDPDTRGCLHAEREFLRLLQADCNQPVGVFAMVDGNQMIVRAQLFRPGATSPCEAVVDGDSDEGEKLAAELFQKLDVY